jgi:hypothetical protein
VHGRGRRPEAREEHDGENASGRDEGNMMNDELTPPGQSPDADAPLEDPVSEAPTEEPVSEAPSGPPSAPAPVAPPAPTAYRPPAAPLTASTVAAAPAPVAGGPPGGETRLTVDYPDQSSRLWALLYLLFGIKSIVLIVHALIFIVIAVGAFVVFVVAQAIVLITGRMSEGLHRFQTSVLAQSNKLNAWVYGLTDVLPPFMPTDDPYPVETSVGHPAESSRLWALLNILWVKPLALLPHLIVLYVLQIASGVVVFIAQIMILVTGTFPRGMFDFVVGVMRWQTRVAAFLVGLRDEYPPFSLQ